jgi:hypothetical protein
MKTLRAVRVIATLVPSGLFAMACGGTVLPGGAADGSADTGHDATMMSMPDTSPPQDGPATEDRMFTPDEGPPDRSVRPIDAGPGGIPCGTTVCSPETQECCIDITSRSESCTSKGACDGGVMVTCSGPESCPTAGDVCCATFGRGTTPMVSCTAADACMGYELCKSSKDCPMGEPCEPSGFPGFDVCRGGFDRDGGFHRRDGGRPPPDGGIMMVDATGPKEASAKD